MIFLTIGCIGIATRLSVLDVGTFKMPSSIRIAALCKLVRSPKRNPVQHAITNKSRDISILFEP